VCKSGGLAFLKPRALCLAGGLLQAGERAHRKVDGMDQHFLKLGDDVIVTSRPHAGREGYVIGITSHDGEATPDSVSVRLLGSPRLDVSLKSNDLKKPEKVR
jgi:hypothetical protein